MKKVIRAAAHHREECTRASEGLLKHPAADPGVVS
jgi:hypothetical protein